MRILFIPDYAVWNPYQSLLKKALEKAGAQVSSAGNFSLRDAFRRRGELDVVHIHWTRPFFDTSSSARFYIRLGKSMVILLVTRVLGIDIVWTVHNLVSHDSFWPKGEFIFNVFLITIAKAVIVHSERCRGQFLDEYHGLGRKKVTVVPHGHYVGAYRNCISRDEARRRLEFGPGDRVFLCMGNVRPYKGLEACIRSFRNIEDPCARLMITGKPITDAFAQELHRCCAPDQRIRCAFGFVADDDLQVYLNAADVMVLPFQNIFTSGSLILGMSFSRPIVAPRMGAVPDYLDGSGAFLYDPEDPEGLANAMRAALQGWTSCL